MLVMLGSLVIGLGVLGGGYAWVLTGSVAVGVATGAGAALGLVWLFRDVARRTRRTRLGEVGRLVGEELFTPCNDAQSRADGTRQEGLARHPELIAGSIRRMLRQRGSV